MTLTDTGPLVAMIDLCDPYHRLCEGTFNDAKLPLATTSACFTEAMYLLGKSAGFRGQQALWQYLTDRALIVIELTNDDLNRCRSFMETYRDVPCDFADATILAIAERLGLRNLLSFDQHFYAYRVLGQPLALHPEPG